jgi:hypothetical protein
MIADEHVLPATHITYSDREEYNLHKLAAVVRTRLPEETELERLEGFNICPPRETKLT